MRVDILSDGQSGLNDNWEIIGDNELELNYSAVGNDFEKNKKWNAWAS